jgi:ribosomal protein L24E
VSFNREPIEIRMSANLTHTSTGGFLCRTRFVLVNDRVPRRDADCALCGSKIEKGYVRESQTHLFYCDTQCFAGHAIAIENHARKAS